MSEKCKTCDGTGSVPAEVETAEGPMLCPYIGAPCPDCPPMPEKLIMVRGSELEALREALDYYACRDHYTYENGPHYSSSPVIMDDKGHVARAALAKSEVDHD